MINILAILALVVISDVSCFFPVIISGTTPPSVACDNNLCNGKPDGNYNYINPTNYESDPHYFLQCSGGIASCQPCWPLHLVFKQTCNQCLYTLQDDCVTTKPWSPATTYQCPDICPSQGPDFSGNINDPTNEFQYVACWEGVTVGCIACSRGLIFNRRWNACLYKRNLKQIPPGREAFDYPPYGK